MPPDLIVTGGAVFAGRERRPGWSVAVEGGRIGAVGPAVAVEELAVSGTRVIEVSGGLVVPGFQDSHVHPDGGGLLAMQCDLHHLSGEAEYVDAVRRYVEANPQGGWITGGGWYLADFPGGLPHRSMLDAVAADRPVYLPNRDWHGAWVNSKALELAGIRSATADPPDGRIERDPDGSPSGVLHEGAMDLVEVLIPPPSSAELQEALLRAQSYLHSLGITAWQDAIVGEASLTAYMALDEAGELTARVVGAHWWDRHHGEEQVEELLERRRRAASGSGRFRATSVKIMQDGICENFTAAMIDPYLGDGRGDGLSFVEPSELGRIVPRLDREGFQVHFHAIGDRAVREALDAIEAAAAANGRGDHRHHIAHIQVVHPDDVPRFATLGVVANAQPLWACLDPQMRDLTLPFLGEERSRWQYPFASLRRAGAGLAMGSDWPVTTPEPLKELQVAVTRVPHDDPDVEPFIPEERLDLAEALTAFTAGSAFVNHLDADTGTIEVGKLADLAVIDRDLFDIPPMEIGQARVVLTLVEGEVVHASLA